MTSPTKSPGSQLTQPEGHLCPSLSGISGNVDRINALYSPFRPKEANPESYDQKMKFWAKAVQEYVTFSNRLTFTQKELEKAFKLNNKVPACLDQVIENSTKSKVILTEKGYEDFLRSSESWLSWSQVSMKNAITKFVPLPWSYFSSSSQETRYVHLVHLKAQVESLWNEGKLHHVLMSLQKFREEIEAVNGTMHDIDFEVLIRYMNTHGMIKVDKVGHQQVVLMAKALGTRPEISLVDKGKYDVIRTKEILETQLEDLNSKIHVAEVNTKQALKQGRRNTAKHELRRKKLLEGRADKLLNMVDNLTVIAMKIEDAESDATMLSAYESGKKALANVFKDNNLTVDRVTEAMLDMQDLLDTQTDINTAIAQPMEGQEDTQELEDELEMLLKQEENKESEKLKQKQEDDTLKLLESLTVQEGELDTSVSSPNSKDLHSSVASES